MPQVFDDISVEENRFKAEQLTKYTFVYNFKAVVANNTTVTAFLYTGNDADFQITGISGCAFGPTDANGVKDISGLGTTIFPMAGTTATADRGLAIKIVRDDTGITLTNTSVNNNTTQAIANGFVPVGNLLSVGYGNGHFYKPENYSYYLPARSRLKIEILNLDTPAGYYHFLDMAFIGKKIYLGGK